MNWPVAAVAAWFFLLENSYFGWNFRPMSDAEIICDGLTLLIFATAFLGAKITINVGDGWKVEKTDGANK